MTKNSLRPRQSSFIRPKRQWEASEKDLVQIEFRNDFFIYCSLLILFFSINHLEQPHGGGGGGGNEAHGDGTGGNGCSCTMSLHAHGSVFEYCST